MKWFNAERGYGFITRNGGEDVFVHISALERSELTSISEGQPVVVDVVEGREGPEAQPPRCAAFRWTAHSNTITARTSRPGEKPETTNPLQGLIMIRAMPSKVQAREVQY